MAVRLLLRLDSHLTAIHVAEGNTAYSSEDGVLFNKDKTTLVCYPIGKTETTYTVPATVTTIETSAFMNCTALTQVTLPEGLTNISNMSFERCAALAQINLPNSLTSIANRAFYGCTSLTEVTLPDGLTKIEFYTFYDCSALEKVTLPEGITYIGNKAFYNCTALTELTVWAITPPTLENDAFTGVGSSLVVKVPAEGLPAYQTADIWKDFTLQAISTTSLQTANTGHAGEHTHAGRHAPQPATVAPDPLRHAGTPSV